VRARSCGEGDHGCLSSGCWQSREGGPLRDRTLAKSAPETARSGKRGAKAPSPVTHKWRREVNRHAPGHHRTHRRQSRAWGRGSGERPRSPHCLQQHLLHSQTKCTTTSAPLRNSTNKRGRVLLQEGRRQRAAQLRAQRWKLGSLQPVLAFGLDEVRCLSLILKDLRQTITPGDRRTTC